MTASSAALAQKQSYALGRWRGVFSDRGRRLPERVALAPTICAQSYADGFAAGREDLVSTESTLRNKGRR